ncbi:MAG: NAD(P)/FAD-dependent oxidoreductase [Candidatus Polarisedimenticolia bacterium]
MAARRVIVVGAGIMGLWSALRLRLEGHDVVVVDAWGAGHSRGTSGDESRVIRAGYGGARLYVRWAERSLKLWSAWGESRRHHHRRPMLIRCGVLWMVGRDPSSARYADRVVEDLEAIAFPHVRMEADAMTRAWPQMRLSGIQWGVLEPVSGALLAREACLELLSDLQERGGVFRQARVRVDRTLDASVRRSGRGGRLGGVTLDTGERLESDVTLFACGPWLASMFPRLVGSRLRVTRKEVFYFGTPIGDDRFDAARLPVWMELGTDCYGLPAMNGKGFKLHPDLPGRRVDPTTMDRRTSPACLRMARAALRRRFPDLRDAPVVETRVCQYESTADDHMFFDRHPRLADVWIVGGGSGHCFKHGPVIGEMVAEAIHRDTPEAIPPELRWSHTASGRNF